MAFSVEYTETALRQLRRLDRQVARRIVEVILALEVGHRGKVYD